MPLRLAVPLILLLTSVAHSAIVFESEPNDAFAQADQIQCGDTVQCAGLDAMGGDDAFRFFAPPGDSIYLTTFACGDAVNTIVCLYDSSGNLIDCNDDGAEAQFSRLGYFCFSPGSYFVKVFRHGLAGSEYSLSLICMTRGLGDNDLCSNARDVTFLPYYDEASTTGAGSEAGTQAPDVFYHFQMSDQGNVQVQVCSEFFDARVQLLTHCVGGFGDDSDAGVCQLGADLTIFALQPGDYYLMLEGTSAAQFGDYSVELSLALPPCPPIAGLVIFRVAGMPFLDWPTEPSANYYLIEQSSNVDGPFEGLAIAYDSYYTDSTGFLAQKRFYQVRAICN